jgi:integrase
LPRLTPPAKALFGLIYHHGFRVGEALMLTVDDVNFTTHRITIRRSKNKLGGEKPLWRHTATLLRRALRERRDLGPYLFTGRKGPLQKRLVQKLFTEDSFVRPTSPLARLRLGRLISKTLRCYRGTHLVRWLDSPRQFAILPALCVSRVHPLALLASVTHQECAMRKRQASLSLSPNRPAPPVLSGATELPSTTRSRSPDVLRY